MNRAVRQAVRAVDANFGVIRLSRKEQIRRILQIRFDEAPDSYIFSREFERDLRDACDKSNNWLIGIVFLQCPLYFYLALSSQHLNIDIMLFGMKVPSTPELKAYVLLISSAFNFFAALMTKSAEYRFATLSAIMALRYPLEPKYIIDFISSESFYIRGWSAIALPGFILIRQHKTEAFLMSAFAIITVFVGWAFLSIIHILIYIDVIISNGFHKDLATMALVLSMMLAISSILVSITTLWKEKYLPQSKNDAG